MHICHLNVSLAYMYTHYNKTTSKSSNLSFRFLYAWSVDLDAESVLFVDYAAQKYNIKGLEAKCNSFLENHMSADNVCTILEHATKFDRKDLVETCVNIVNSDAKVVFGSDSFLSVSLQVLELIVEQTITTPLDMYEACKKWANGRIEKQEGDVSGEQIRDLLGVVISRIKFSKMSYEDFMDNIIKDNILNSDQVVKILVDIRDKEKKEKEREKLKKEIMIRRGAKVSKGWGYGGKQDGISFTVSTNVWLTAVDLFLPLTNGDTLTGPFEVFEDQTNVLTTNLTLIGQNGKQFESFKLPTRVQLQEGKVYSLRQRMKGNNSFYASSCFTNICVDNVNVTFRNLVVGSSDNETCPFRGQCHGLTLTKD